MWTMKVRTGRERTVRTERGAHRRRPGPRSSVLAGIASIVTGAPVGAATNERLDDGRQAMRPSIDCRLLAEEGALCTELCPGVDRADERGGAIFGVGRRYGPETSRLHGRDAPHTRTSLHGSWIPHAPAPPR